MRKCSLLFCLSLFFVFALSPHAFALEVPEGFYAYTVQAGDTLSKIAPEKTWDIIMRINRIDQQHLQIDQEILIPLDAENIPDFCPVPQEIEELREEPRAVQAFLDIQYFGAYEFGQLVFWGPISSADEEHYTPTGVFHVLQKQLLRISQDPEAFGARLHFAILFEEKRGILFHQYELPGRPASHSCIRLLMSDAKTLYYWIHLGDPVIIVA